jgi:transcription elongation factor
LPEIHLHHLQDLGKDGEGITTAELTQKVLQVVLQRASEAAVSALPQLTKGALNLTNAIPGSALDNAQKVTKGLGDLLKPKK